MRKIIMQAIVLLTLLTALGGCCWHGNCGPTPPREGHYSSDQRQHRQYRDTRVHRDRAQDRELYRDRYRDRDDWRRRYDPSRDGYHEEYRR